MSEYALYKGESMLTMGTLKEIADEMGVKKDTITYYGTHTYTKRGKGENRRILIKLED